MESHDLSDKGSDSLSGISSGSSPAAGDQKKTCADCGTSKTPLWRGGPAGPKSLCNACGIRSRKKRRAILGMPAEQKKPKKTNVDGSGKLGDSLKQSLYALGREMIVQKRSSIERQRRKMKLGEEEQAAFLLMALSCGSVYA